MGCDEKELRPLDYSSPPVEGLGKELRVSDPNYLVDQKNFRITHSCDRKRKAQHHAGRIGAHWDFEIFSQLGEFGDLVDAILHLLPRQPPDRSRHLNIFKA